MDTDGPGIGSYTKVINPAMVITYASDDDKNSKSDRAYEPEDDNDDILGAK